MDLAARLDEDRREGGLLCRGRQTTLFRLGWDGMGMGMFALLLSRERPSDGRG